VTNRTRLIAAAVIVLLFVAGILVFRGRGSGNSATRTAPSATAPTSPSASSASTAPTGPVVPTLTHLATVDKPTAITARPNDTSMFVAEQIGRVRRLRKSGNTYTLDSSPVLDVSADVKSGGEQGLLGLAFSADGSHLYFAFTNNNADQQVDEIAFSGDSVVDSSRRTLIVVPDFAPNHNGGDLILGPDGYLYYGMGDGGGAGDPKGSGQNPHDLLGDILRIDPQNPSAGKPYGIPASNPFADGQSGAPEVWDWGLRNPWRFSFDRSTKDLWIADVGQAAEEEIDFEPAGSKGGVNYGWSAVEGTKPFAASAPPAGAVPPIYEYDHSNGRCSITGGFVYRGRALPDLVGTYLFGDNCDGEIRGLTRNSDGNVNPTDLHLNVSGLSSFGEDNDGELYALGVVDGSVSRLDPVPAASGSGAAPPPAPAAQTAAALSADPTAAADQLVAAEAVIRDPAATPDALAAAAHVQQLAYRRLGRQPDLYPMIVSRAPVDLRDAIARNLDARNELALIPGGPLKDTLPAWRIVAPAPPDELVGYYHEAEQQFGVGWNYLAAINLIESAMGRIEGLSAAGAQGPMQFMPSTWDKYGNGGDVSAPHDAILGAARYLAANGFADGNVDGALYHYNNSDHYVNAIKDIAAVLAASPQAYAGYYRWEVYYVTTIGDVHLPVGYETADRISAADYVATHPQES
jgi:glucose/arabinose dehydrogenase